MVIKTATVIVINDDGLILGVSRKTDHNDFGFPGGKLEEYDENIIEGLKRETKEETGLDLIDIKLIHEGSFFDGFYEHTFVAKSIGDINFDPIKEAHVVKWVLPEKVMDGSFGKYNEDVLKLIGIKRRTGASLVEAKLKWFFGEKISISKAIDKLTGY